MHDIIVLDDDFSCRCRCSPLLSSSSISFSSFVDDGRHGVVIKGEKVTVGMMAGEKWSEAIRSNSVRSEDDDDVGDVRSC